MLKLYHLPRTIIAFRHSFILIRNTLQPLGILSGELPYLYVCICMGHCQFPMTHVRTQVTIPYELSPHSLCHLLIPHVYSPVHLAATPDLSKNDITQATMNRLTDHFGSISNLLSVQIPTKNWFTLEHQPLFVRGIDTSFNTNWTLLLSLAIRLTNSCFATKMTLGQKHLLLRVRLTSY